MWRAMATQLLDFEGHKFFAFWLVLKHRRRRARGGYKRLARQSQLSTGTGRAEK